MSTYENLKDLMCNRLKDDQIDKALNYNENVYAITIFSESIDMYMNTPLVQNWIRIYEIIQETVKEHFNLSAVIFNKNVDMLYGYYELNYGFMHGRSAKFDAAKEDAVKQACREGIKKSLSEYFCTLRGPQGKDPAATNECVVLLEDDLFADKSREELIELYLDHCVAPKKFFLKRHKEMKSAMYKNIRTGINVANERGKND